MFEEMRKRPKVKIEEKVNVHNLIDIRRIVANFSGKDVGDSVISASIEYVEDNVRKVEKIEAKVKNPSPRVLLLDGLEVIKKRIEFIELNRQAHAENPDVQATVEDLDNTKFWVDQLIANRMGGARHGLNVRWTIPEGTYEWDPFVNELKKVADA